MWKDYLISRLSPLPGMRLLDVAGGTGDIAFRFLERARASQLNAVGSAGRHPYHVTVTDINRSMLDVGARRADQRGYTPSESACRWRHGFADLSLLLSLFLFWCVDVFLRMHAYEAL